MLKKELKRQGLKLEFLEFGNFSSIVPPSDFSVFSTGHKKDYTRITYCLTTEIRNQTKNGPKSPISESYMADLRRFERLTYGLGGRRSIH